MKPSTPSSSAAEEVTFLTYHALVERADELARFAPEARLYVFTLDEFRRHLDHLAAEGFTAISMAGFLQWHQGQAPLPRRPILLSFDDGHISNAELALPALRERGQRAIFFITAGRIQGGCRSPIADRRFQPEPPDKGCWITWPHLRSLLAAGMEVGSHGLSHRAPASLAVEELRRELVESKRILQEGLGTAIDFVASPTGYDSRHLAPLAREAGYKAALQGVIGRNSRSTDPFALRRIVLKRTMDFALFCRLVDPASRAYRSLRARQMARNALRRLLGERGYEALRRRLLARGENSSGC